MLFSIFTEGNCVIDEDKNKGRRGKQGLDTTISKEFGMLTHLVHNHLKGGWCIDEPKGKHPELLVVTAQACLDAVPCLAASLLHLLKRTPTVIHLHSTDMMQPASLHPNAFRNVSQREFLQHRNCQS